MSWLLFSTMIIEALRCVDRVILTKHVPDTEDMSVLESLKELRPSLFANGGDRTAGNIPEYAFCEAKGITLIFNVGAGGKVRASSDLLADFHAHIQARKNNP
jgi:hypothetical protein